MSSPAKEQSVQQKSTPRSRFKPQRNVGMRLEERDEQILSDLFLHRLMARGQIEQVYFSSTVRCNARLRLLFDHKFVMRHFPPAAPFGAQAIYSIGKAALPIVSRRLEMDLPEVTRYFRRTQTPTFIEHTLSVVDIWIKIRSATDASEEVKLDLWLAEMQCRHTWDICAEGGKWHTESFKPDAFFRLRQENAGEFRNFFVESDLGHTSAKQFTGKLLTHQLYLESGLFEQIFGANSFHTLVVTTGERRLKNLKELAIQENSQLFWFTTFDRINNATILNPVRDKPEQTLDVLVRT